MDLSTALSAHKGREVEAFLESQFYTGTIEDVSDTYVTLRVVSSYDGEAELVNLLLSAIEYIRILMVA